MRFSSYRCRHFPDLVEFLEFSAAIPVALLLKGELRGKNEVILYSRPIFSTSIFDNSLR